jgi:hypothetical protein
MECVTLENETNRKKKGDQKRRQEEIECRESGIKVPDG